jgi:catechol 2,3-dioxygenase-like lactoylglutathione lyase family enzyme
MRLNHLDLQVSDVPATAAWFVEHFGLVLASNGTSPALAILGDEAGFSLVLQRKKREEDAYPDGFHIGFLVETVEAVLARREALLAAGVEGVSEVIVNGRGTIVYVRGPSGVLVEVSCRRTKSA